LIQYQQGFLRETVETCTINRRGEIVRLITKGMTVLVLLCLLTGVAAAENMTIPGNTTFTEDELWSSTYDTVFVDGNITVPNGVTLTIEAGVTVFFRGDYSINVSGILDARGMAPEVTDDSLRYDPDDIEWVKFTQDTTGLNLNWTTPEGEGWDSLWKGIRFDSAPAGSILQYVIIEYGYARGDWPESCGGGIFVHSSSPTIKNCILRYNRAEHSGGGIYLYYSNPEFRNNVIANNYAGEAGGGVFVDNSDEIEFWNLTVVQNRAGANINAYHGNGMYFGPNAVPFVRSSILFSNDGLSVNDDDAYYNAGSIPSDITPFKYCVITTLSEDEPDNFNYKGKDAGGREIVYFEDDYYWTLSDSSRAVDFGDPNDPMASNEPLPSGGPQDSGNPHINIGAWGGTQFSTRSLGVGRQVDGAGDPFIGTTPFAGVSARTRPGESNPVTLQLKNIGSGYLSILMNDANMYWVSGPTQSRYSWIESDEPILARPDSVAIVQLLYTPLEGDHIYQDAEHDVLELVTNAGTFRWEIRKNFHDPKVDETVTVDALDYDTVYIAQPETLQVEIANIGTTNLNLTSYTSMDYFSVVESDVDSMQTIAPQTSRTYNVVCDPSTVGPIQEELRIGTNDESISITLSAYAVGPLPQIIRPLDQNIDFDFVDLNDTRTRSIGIINNGNRDLVITSTSNTDQASFYFNPPALNKVIGPGEEDSLIFVFDPDRLGEHLDTLRINTNTYPFDPFYITGIGTQGGIYFSDEIPNIASGISSVWGAGDDSVYVCAGASFIPPGKNITILPGVRVEFERPRADAIGGPNFIQVEGTLEVFGTEDEKVHFVPQEGAGTLHGGLIFLSAEQGTRLEWAVIDSGTTWTVDEIEEYLDPDDDIDEPFDTAIPHQLGHGGGITVYNCNPSFYQVTVKNCESLKDGGGVWVYQSQPTFTRCSIMDNVAATDGGGAMFWGSAPYFYSNLVSGNTAVDGGGIYMRSHSSPLVANSIITGNTATGLGDGISMKEISTPNFLNSVIANNVDDGAEIGVYVSDLSKPVFRNSVIIGHAGAEIDTSAEGSTITGYNVVEGGWAANDLNIDPQLAFDANGFVVRDENSPLVDIGDPSSAFEDYSFPPSMGTATADIGVYGGPYAGYWANNPIQIRIFHNTANPAGLHFVVNAMQALSTEPTLMLSTHNSDEELTLSAIGDRNRSWRAGYTADKSSYIELVATATYDDGSGVTTASIRRTLAVSLFRTTVGAELSDNSGARLILPPNSVGADMVVIGENDLNASVPEEMIFAAIAGPRWEVKAPVESWSDQAEIVMPYNTDLVRTGTEEGLSVWRCNTDGEWSRLESYVDINSGTVHAKSTGPGRHATFYEPAGSSSEILPTKSQLGANYPNPFNPTTNIPFVLSGASRVEIGVFNILGQKVATITNNWFTAGNHVVMWNGRNAMGHEVASGVYLYRMESRPADGSAGIVQTRKLVLMR
jgi:parallel beta-helix repeat protein